MTKTTPITAWIESVDRTPLMDALSFVNAEIARLQNVRTSLTDALFPPTGDRAIEPVVGGPVPEWFVENLRKKRELCCEATLHQDERVSDRALVQYQLLDELLQQATEGKP